MSQEGDAASDAELAAGQEPDLWDMEEDDAEEMADFEEGASSRWAASRSNGVKGTKSCNGEYTDNTDA